MEKDINKILFQEILTLQIIHRVTNFTRNMNNYLSSLNWLRDD